MTTSRGTNPCGLCENWRCPADRAECEASKLKKNGDWRNLLILAHERNAEYLEQEHVRKQLPELQLL